MTKINIDPREKTDCTVKQYGSLPKITNPRELILQTAGIELTCVGDLLQDPEEKNY